MKKLLSIMLALVLILSMSTVAFATENETEKEPWNGTYKATEAKEFKEIVKTYTSENNVVVNETLSFTSTASTSNPDYELDDDGNNKGANLTVDNLTINSTNFNVKEGENAAFLNVKIPSLSKAGTYEWTIKENAGNTAGVTYSTDEVHVIVYVGYDNENHALTILNTNSFIKKENGEKAKTFTNTFKSGSFTVAKDVIGNMANETDTFEITVTLTSTQPIGTNVTLAGTTVDPSQWTTNYEADGTTVKNYTHTYTRTYSEIAGAKTFSDIPTGVTVTVTEDTTTQKMNGYTYEGIYTAYTVENNKVKDGATGFTSLTIEDSTTAESNKITVVNSKETSIETGIALDSMPYFLMLAVACMGLVVFFMKKRNAREY